MTYSIYLNQTLIIEGVSELTYQLTSLDELTNYNGKIVAKDSNNNETSKTFSFLTEKYFLKYLKKYDYGEVSWSTTGYASGRPLSMLKTNDDKYIIAGVSDSPYNGGDGYRFFVSKIDYEGNEIWKKFYDYQLADSWRFKIAKTSSGFLLAGNKHVLNLDYDGNVIWYKEIESYGRTDSSSEIRSAKQDSQGNIFLVGGRGSENSSIKQQAVLTKLDISGNILWEKTYEPSKRNFFNDLMISDTDDLIILGIQQTNDTDSTNDELIDFWVIKLNNEGEIIWENIFGDGKYDVPTQIISTSDNGYAVVGYGPSLFKIDNSGDLVWSNTELSAYNPTFSISETLDNGFITTGRFVFGNFGALGFSKYDSNGNLEWEKSYQESFTYLFGYAILTENDGGYRIAGTSFKNYYYNEEKPSLLIFKTDPQGDHEY